MNEEQVLERLRQLSVGLVDWDGGAYLDDESARDTLRYALSGTPQEHPRRTYCGGCKTTMPEGLGFWHIMKCEPYKALKERERNTK